ncbi:hypothetical protein AVEN_151684-1 [Araneus ventricosus]|uniref:Uncharacterized protein n=1 Tax=Araneus ventricosus TaxID=182803 RepID=A0A4Y2R690_ARAVE|nr:hypothetical protein AVEN_151684-1 [Araneus ventricosus]
MCINASIPKETTRESGSFPHQSKLGSFQVKPSLRISDAADSESCCIDYCAKTGQIANSRPIQTFTLRMIPRLMTPDWLGGANGQTLVLGNPNGLNFLEVLTFHSLQSGIEGTFWKSTI